MSCRTDAPREQFDADEERLVAHAKAMRVRELNEVIRVWAAHTVDAEVDGLLRARRDGDPATSSLRGV